MFNKNINEIKNMIPIPTHKNSKKKIKPMDDMCYHCVFVFLTI